MDVSAPPKPIDAAVSLSAPQDTRLAFIHIPKTAGTSFTRALAVGWPRLRIVATPDQFLAIPEEAVADLDLVAGHFLHHLLDAPHWRSFTPLTVLRDPRARLVSSYRYGRSVAREPGVASTPGMRFAATVSFAEYAFSMHGVGGRHAQIVMLAREKGENPHDRPLRDLLARAKAVLEQIEVGTSDRLQDYVDYLYRLFGKGPAPTLKRLNTAEGRQDDDADVLQLTHAQDEALRELMRPDEELVEHGRRLFETRREALERGTECLGTPQRR